MDVNRAHHALMFATGSFNGDLTIWRTSDDGDGEEGGNVPDFATNELADEPRASGGDTEEHDVQLHVVGETADILDIDASVAVDSPLDSANLDFPSEST